MNRNIFIALIALFITGIAMGQQREKTKSTEEVIIKKKGGTDEKMTIVIDGDQITINGRPVTEFDGENIIIRKKALEGAMAPLARTMPRMRIMGSPDFDFNENFNFNFDDLDMRIATERKPQAMLGVMTEKAEKGLKLSEVTPGSAAEKAGLKQGDVITKFGGTAVYDPEALRELVLAKKPADEVELAYIKSGEKKEKILKVTLGSLAPKVGGYSISPATPRPPRPPKAPRPPYPGVPGEMFPAEPMVPMAPYIQQNLERELSNFKRPQLGVRIQDTDDSSGVKVLDVNDGSLAAVAGIKENDVIVSIDGKRIKDTDGAREALQSAREKSSYPITLNRQGSVVNVDVKVPKRLKKTDL